MWEAIGIIGGTIFLASQAWMLKNFGKVSKSKDVQDLNDAVTSLATLVTRQHTDNLDVNSRQDTDIQKLKSTIEEKHQETREEITAVENRMTSLVYRFHPERSA